MLQSCFAPCTFTVSYGGRFQVAVADYGGYNFTQWNEGTSARFHDVVIGNPGISMTLTAVFGH